MPLGSCDGRPNPKLSPSLSHCSPTVRETPISEHLRATGRMSVHARRVSVHRPWPSFRTTLMHPIAMQLTSGRLGILISRSDKGECDEALLACMVQRLSEGKPMRPWQRTVPASCPCRICRTSARVEQIAGRGRRCAGRPKPKHSLVSAHGCRVCGHWPPKLSYRLYSSFAGGGKNRKPNFRKERGNSIERDGEDRL